MVRYGMVIDLKKCVGCQACTVACKAESFVPSGILWNQVLEEESGKYPSVMKTFLPKPCMHCDNPPCVKVCPVKATWKREDGIVVQDYERCIGCRYCLVACPYGARSFNWGNPGQRGYYYPATLTPYEKLPYDLRAPQQKHIVGVVEKCTFCVHRIDEGTKNGLKPGVDREATPACVLTCISEARHFGDLDDPTSEVSVLIARRHGFRLFEEFGTEPSVYYLPP